MVTVASLAWLAGCWRTADGVSEECWMPPRAELMVGMHRDVREGRPPFYEALRIEVSGGEVVYVASPKGQETTTFSVESASGQKVVFANPTHDFPQRITYERTGDQLVATISGTVGGQERRSSWTFSRDPKLLD